MYDLSTYDEEFYALVRREGLAMAPWFVPLLKRIFDFTSIIDVGCGQGHYLLELLRQNAESPSSRPIQVCGLEGSPWACQNSLVPGFVHQHDLRVPLQDYWRGTRFDLAISIEVAEHIEAEFADIYVGTLCDLSNVVLITSATPGQGGHWHVNERLPIYWILKFNERGFILDEGRTDQIKSGIRTARGGGQYVTAWFEPNVAVFRKQSAL
jgi:hypothetical protein